MARYTSKPYFIHLKAAKHLLRYLIGTKDYQLVYTKEVNNTDNKLVLNGYSDADWAGDTATRSSTLGNIILLNGNIVHWSSQRQKSIAQSSTESEYVGVNVCARELVWFQSILYDIFDQHLSSIIYTDSQSSEAWCN